MPVPVLAPVKFMVIVPDVGKLQLGVPQVKLLKDSAAVVRRRLWRTEMVPFTTRVVVPEGAGLLPVIDRCGQADEIEWSKTMTPSDRNSWR